MYPSHYFGLFPPFPRENKVFVAMSFKEQFTSRWKNVIVPAIENEKVNGIPLKPHRVDTNHISDSILTEILAGISNDQLVFADITAITIENSSVRNENVMYEVGLAHAIRRPEEVLLFRSDSASLPFNISSVRVNKYNPDNDYGAARQIVGQAIRDAIKERNLMCQNSIKKAAASLDISSWAILINALADSINIKDIPDKHLGNAIGNSPNNSAIRRLLEMGALEADFRKHSFDSIKGMQTDSEMFSYKLTPFGHALIAHVNRETIDSTELWNKLAKFAGLLS